MQYRFEGHLTAHDCKRHIPHRFVVPANCGAAELHFTYEPHRVSDVSNLLTLTLFDPAGFRGAGHRDGASECVRLTANEATPGYLPGPLPAGEWVAQIDTHMIMPGVAVHYWLDVTLAEDVSPATATLSAPTARPYQAPRRGPGWYRGDLHSHTHHSDADGGRTVAELIQAARDEGLDFIFLTDHNTTAGLAEMDASASEKLLTAGGIELTTFWGHALCLGTRAWVDWRVLPGTGDMARVAAETYDDGQVFIIAHPQSIGDPTCTGCAWRYGELMPGIARMVEIWNGPWKGDSNNEQTLALWYDWLNQGRRLVATAGTDTHSTQDYAARPGFSLIYAEELSEAALLKALRAGHVYLSAGPKLAFQASVEGGGLWIVGDTVTQPVTLTIAWAGCPSGAQVRLIANGKLLSQWPAGAEGESACAMSPEQADWVVAEIRGIDGGLLAITNPIFFTAQRDVASPGRCAC